MVESPPFRFKRTKQSKLLPIITTATVRNSAIVRRKSTPQKVNKPMSLVSRSLSKSPLATRNRPQRLPFLQLPRDNNQLSPRSFSNFRSRSQNSAASVFLDSSKDALAKKRRSLQSIPRKKSRSLSPAKSKPGTPCVLSSKVGKRFSPIFSSLLHYNLQDLEEIGMLRFLILVCA